MYSLFLGETLFPVAPAKISLKVKNQNTTITLINESEVNILKLPGLTDINFKALLPNSRYPFAQYSGGFEPPEYFLSVLESLKTGKQPFQFIVSRSKQGGGILFDTNMTVSLEDYKIDEDAAAQGYDLTVDIHLKQWREYGTKIIEISFSAGDTTPQATVEQPRRDNAAEIGVGSLVVVNGRLHKNSYGDGPGKTLSNYKGKVNFLNFKGSHPYHVTDMSGGWLGWVLSGDVTAAGG